MLQMLYISYLKSSLFFPSQAIFETVSSNHCIRLFLERSSEGIGPQTHISSLSFNHGAMN